MTQPKLSNALSRLRSITGDPLLVRTPSGMMPTELAQELAAQCGNFLMQWDSLIGRESVFNAAEAQRNFTICTTETFTQDILLKAAQKARAVAPGISFSVSRPTYNNVRDALDTGEVDLAIGWTPDLAPDLFISQLAAYDVCCVIAANHPRIGEEMTLEQYARESHVQLTYGRPHHPFIIERYAEQILASKGIQRKIAFYMPSPLLVPELVAVTDLIGLVARPLAEAASRRFDIRVLAPPFQMPQQEVSMIWHVRTKNDPANRWLRNFLRESSQPKPCGDSTPTQF